MQRRGQLPHLESKIEIAFLARKTSEWYTIRPHFSLIKCGLYHNGWIIMSSKTTELLASDIRFSQLFSIGIGPSSSHTVGPMRAITDFLQQPAAQSKNITRITVELKGSLALTGRGHGTDRAIILALLGEKPETVDPESIPTQIANLANSRQLALPSGHQIGFDPSLDIIFNFKDKPDYHPNTLIARSWGGDTLLLENTYYSIGGGFIECKDHAIKTIQHTDNIPYAYSCGNDLLELCEENNCSIADLVFENELASQMDPVNKSQGVGRRKSEEKLRQQVQAISEAMTQCLERGYKQAGVLPGRIAVKRRAKQLYLNLMEQGPLTPSNPQRMGWLNVFAMAVNEENAGGSRVVTAPTNGAAGIIPAVLEYSRLAYEKQSADHDIDFLLTATAIGSLYKANASISGAEVGCQGEVGSACSMAAAGLAAVLGGSPIQVENAAEIAMEHNLGLTCDPVGGLVQIPCIERNAMAAVKAVNAAELAIAEEGSNHVSLDTVIKTMLQIGKNMSDIYKETALGGLASTVNIPEC